ncbi:MAG: tetratricopeptide repeat protein [Candidatus Hodarchaeales archaeon]
MDLNFTKESSKILEISFEYWDNSTLSVKMMTTFDIDTLTNDLKLLKNQGNYTQGIVLINDLKKNYTSSDQEIYTLNYFLADIYYDIAEYKDALRIVIENLDSKEIANNFLLMIDFSILKANIHWRLGEPQEGLKSLNYSETLIIKSNSTNIKDLEIRKASFMLAKASILQVIDKLDSSIALLKQAYNTYEKVEDSIGIIITLNRFGRVHWKKAEFKTAIEFHEKALALSTKIDNQALIAQSSMSLGIVYIDTGDFNQALMYNRKSLILWDVIGHKYYYGATLNNTGEIFLLRGELEESLKYFEDALKIFEEIGNDYIKADIINNMGIIFQFKGDYNKSKECLLECIKIYENLNNFIDASKPYYLLVKNLIELNEIDEVNKYFTQFKSLKSKSDNELVHQRFSLVNAFLLESSQRSINKVKAHEIFKELEEKSILDYNVTIIAMLKQSEFLLEELFTTGNLEIIDELEEKIEKLSEIGRKQKVFPLIIECLLFKSRLALLNIDIERAKELLLDAELLANEKQIKSLIRKTEDTRYELTYQATILSQFKNIKDPVNERMKMLKFDTYLSQHFDRYVLSHDQIMDEIPIMFNIASESGIKLFHIYFEEESKIDSHLISGFLTAINEFGKQTFLVKESIKKISIQDYNLIIKPWENLLFSYVFKGSYTPVYEKFQDLLKNLTKILSEWLTELKIDYIPLNEEKEKAITEVLRKYLKKKEN